ncbi:MAG: CAP domain-containing protein [Ilumatobacteraceae bacterium]
MSAISRTPPTPRRRRPWTYRLTNVVGAFGMTTVLGLAAAPAVALRCAPPPSLEQQVVNIVNQRRAETGLGALRVDPTLTVLAQAHAADQAGVDRMSHTGTDGSDPATRIIRSGYPVRVWGENVAGGYTSSEAVTAAWMESPSHRAIILDGRFREIGVGLAYAPDGSAYWSLELGRRQ